jgi:hypothetical protein
MRASWAQSFSGDFAELVLTTLANEGEDATLARLLAKLDEASLPVRRDPPSATAAGICQ